MKTITLIFLLFLVPSISAQSNFTSSGKKASSSNGSVNYSVGQVFYTQQESSGGFVNNGVQVASEVLTLSINQDVLLNFSAKVYPNPTVKEVFIKLENVITSNLSYQVFNLNGKKITEAKKIIGETTKVSMNKLPASVYFLQIKSNNQHLKTIKIVKTQ